MLKIEELVNLGYRKTTEQKLGRKLWEDEWNAWVIDWIATNRPNLLTERMEVEKFEYREGLCRLCYRKKQYPQQTREELLTNYYTKLTTK